MLISINTTYYNITKNALIGTICFHLSLWAMPAKAEVSFVETPTVEGTTEVVSFGRQDVRQDNHQKSTQQVKAKSIQSDLVSQDNNRIFKQKIRYLYADEVAVFNHKVHPYGINIIGNSIAASDSKMAVANMYRKLGLSFEFATVQGSLYGIVTGDILSNVPVRNRHGMTLQLPAKIDAVEINMPDFSVNTFGKSVKFARLSTIPLIDVNKKHLIDVSDFPQSAGFIDGHNMEDLVLVYTSDKVDIVGKQVSLGKTYHYDISLPEKGWHWLIKQEKSNNNVLMTYVDSDKIDPVIYAAQ